MILYDISQTISEKTAVWPGDQKFRHRWSMQMRRGDSCNVSAVTLSVHTGTHLDAPYHFDESGGDVANIPLQQCIGPARVVVVPEELRRIDAGYLAQLDWRGVERVLFQMRASTLPEEQFSRDYVCLDESGAGFLGERRMLLVGTDAPSIEAFDSKTLACHKILAKQGVVLLEGTRLRGVPPGDYDLICFPLKLSGLDGSPVRAVLTRNRGEFA